MSYDHYQKLEKAEGVNNQGNFSFTTPNAASAGALTTLGASAPTQFDAEWASFLVGNVNNTFSQANIDSNGEP